MSTEVQGEGRRPLVSVFMPVYNAEKYVAEALLSVLAQTHTNLEVVVSDDASSDRSAEILREFARRDSRVRLFVQERNLGVTANCNFLLERCSGDYVCFFAGDDVLKANCLEAMLKHAISDPNLAIVFHAAGRIDGESRPLPYPWNGARTHTGRLVDFLERGVYVGLNGMLVRSSFLDGCSYDPELPYASDLSILYGILQKSGAFFLFLAEDLSSWRKHATSQTQANNVTGTLEQALENHRLALRFPSHCRNFLVRARAQALDVARVRHGRIVRAFLRLAFAQPIRAYDHLRGRKTIFWSLRHWVLARL